VSSNPAKGPLVDAEPVRRHVRNLMAAGVSVQRIAEHAGISFAVVSGLLYTRGPGRGRAEKIRLLNAQCIYSVKAENLVAYYVDPTGTHRRIQALMANGWPQLRLGPHFGLHPVYVNAILRQPSIYGTTAVAVAAAYDRLWNQDPRQHGVSAGTYKKIRNLARANGWVPPAAWDDDAIDDPNAKPDLGDRVLNFHERAQLRREEIIHLAWCGNTPEQILDRLDNEVSISTVRQIVQEWRTGKKRDRTQQEKTAKAGLEAAA
jgi:transposase